MNSIYKNFMKQFKKPEGKIGKLIIKGMNISHFELTSWGLENIKFNEESDILDIGCGGGRTVNRLAYAAKNSKVFGMDYSLNSVNEAKSYNKELIKEGKVNILHASVEKIPFDDNKFDIITAVETIYFWPDILSNFMEVKRVLKPSGKFVVINEVVENENFKKRNERYSDACEMKIYAPKQMEELFIKAGFLNIKVDVLEDKNWLRVVGEK